MKRIAILGIGKSGVAATRWALKRGMEVILSDCMPIEDWPPELVSWCRSNHVKIDAGGHSEEKILNSHCIVPSPGVPLTIPVLKEAFSNGIPVIGEMAIGMGLWKGPVIGITGTNGKTTVTTLIAKMLEKAKIPFRVAGNIGRPILDLFEEDSENSQETILVLEISSFQLDLFPVAFQKVGTLLGLKRPRFRIACLLNIDQDHLERYGTQKEYARSKARMFLFQKRADWAVLRPSELQFLRDLGLTPRARIHQIRPELDNGTVAFQWPEGGKEQYQLGHWGLMGRHNLENLVAAASCARLIGCKKAPVQEAIDEFKAPSSRMEVVGEVNGVKFINDSKATNTHATLAAVEALPGKIILILGGLGKGQDFSRLKAIETTGKVKSVILMGDSKKELNKVFEKIPCACVANGKSGEKAMAEATKMAFDQTGPGDTVLLSPACASFDMFSNYEERGNAFRKAVDGLKE